MYTLKGIFPEPKKEQKKNFIKENMKQLKLIQGKSPKENKITLKSANPPRYATPTVAATSLGQIQSSVSNKKTSLSIGKSYSSNSKKKHTDMRVKKGDMAEFLKRKELLAQQQEELVYDDTESSHSSGRLRDIACQTVESNFQKPTESTKLTMLYPTREDDESKMKASGDSAGQGSPQLSGPLTPRQLEESIMEERNRSRINAILERKDKDPYLPPGYQKGVVPKYLRERKENAKEKEVEDAKVYEEHAVCPPGHVTLPDMERKETLRMLRNSFAELVNELNKMPVKTDTLRMRNRKMELEKQLAKLEEGIKVFSRPKVFVKIGE